MPILEIKDLYSIYFYPLINRPFSLSWSKDDFLSILTEKGVQILEFFPFPHNVLPEFTFKWNWIEPDESKITGDTGIDYNFLCAKYEQNTYCLITDVNATPNLKPTSDLPPRIIDIAWSDRGMLLPDRCILAVLTNYGSLQLKVRYCMNWITSIDVSQCWKKHCQEIWNQNILPSNPNELIKLHQKRSSMLSITSVQWSEKFIVNKVPLSILVTGTKNGEIAVWFIEEQLSNRNHNFESNIIEPKLVIPVLNTKISSLHSYISSAQSGLITVGGENGCIKLIKVIIQNENIQIEKESLVWSEEDNIQVSKVYLFHFSENFFVLIAIKDVFLLVFLLNNQEEVVSNCHHFFESLILTGIHRYTFDNWIASTLLGNVYSVKIIISPDNKIEINVTLLPLLCEKIIDRCYGITASNSEAIWATVWSPRRYDHLKKRDGVQLLFHTFKNLEETWKIILNNPSQTFWTVRDHLEIIRIQSALETIPKIPGISSVLDELTDLELKLELWFARFGKAHAQHENNSQQKIVMLKKVHQIQQLLFTRNAIKQLNFLHENKKIQEENFKSQSLFLSWLKLFTSRKKVGTTCEKAIAVLAQFSKAQLDNEICKMCQRIVPMQDWRVSQCPVGHIIPRCPLTMNQCVDLPYRICKMQCNVIYFNKQDCAPCIFCDFIPVVDERILRI